MKLRRTKNCAIFWAPGNKEE